MTVVRISLTALLGAATVMGGVALAPAANADQVAYLVNVTVRPGYNFPNAQAALDYGYSVCDRVAAQMSYGDLINQIKTDFNTTDEWQGGYMIHQAVNELCPAQIWQVRRSAVGYRAPLPPT